MAIGTQPRAREQWGVVRAVINRSSQAPTEGCQLSMGRMVSPGWGVLSFGLFSEIRNLYFYVELSVAEVLATKSEVLKCGITVIRCCII